MTSVSKTVAGVVLLVCLAVGIMIGVTLDFSLGDSNINNNNNKALRGNNEGAPEQHRFMVSSSALKRRYSLKWGHFVALLP